MQMLVFGNKKHSKTQFKKKSGKKVRKKSGDGSNELRNLAAEIKSIDHRGHSDSSGIDANDESFKKGA